MIINEAETEIVVHVVGHVINPGIVKLKENSRVIDAIIAAGGASGDARLDLINLAYILEDGMKIYVPSSEDEEISNDSQIDSLSNSNQSKSIRININNATEADFEKIPGIGASIAKRIITYRQENGKFSSIEDLKNVSGIGESKFNNIKNYVYVK